MKRKVNKFLLGTVVFSSILSPIFFSTSCFWDKIKDFLKPNDEESTNIVEPIPNIIDPSDEEKKIALARATKGINKIKTLISDTNINLNSIKKDIDNNQLLTSNLKKQIKDIAQKTYDLWNKFNNLSPKVYKEYSLREKRYESQLQTFENFIFNYWGYFNKNNPNSGPMANNSPILKKIAELLNNKKFQHIAQNNGYYLHYLKEGLNYWNRLESEISLAFDANDGYWIQDISKLKYLTNIHPTSELKKTEIFEFRKQTLINGIIPRNSYKGVAVNPADIKYSFLNLVYDLSGGYNYYNDIQGSYSYAPSTFKITLSNLRFRTENASEEKAVNKLVRDTIYRIISKKMTDSQKIHAVHNWITDNIDYYDGDLNDKSMENKIRSPYAYVHKKFGVVCEGYARMFQKFMTFLEIPSWYVTGEAKNSSGHSEGHAWNMVKIDGQYLFVDCTWDDPVVNGVDKHNIIHKSITPHSNEHLLVDWKTLSKNNSSRNIDVDFFKLQELRKRLGLNYEYPDFVQITK